MQKQLITKNTNLMELVEKYPEVVEILMGYGLHCVTCTFSQFDSLENGAKLHGMSKDDFEMMLKDLNKLIKDY
ncbi:MAG: DUF1858 domain-containing protein [archaeon]